jgi:hypothetical protein
MRATYISETARVLATIAAVAIGQLSLIMAGCARAPDLPDIFQRSGGSKSFDVEMAAPVVVVGLVERSDEVGRPRRSRRDARLGIQLTRVQIQVEQVLRGAVAKGALKFYYYAFSTQSEVPPPSGAKLYSSYPGKRYIFFLQGFPGGYRSVGDVTDYALLVSSGRHGEDFCRGESVGCCIARILLVPGEGYDAQNMASDLTFNTYPAKVLCSQERALDLVQKLEHSPDPVISQAATETLRPWRTYGDFP